MLFYKIGKIVQGNELNCVGSASKNQGEKIILSGGDNIGVIQYLQKMMLFPRFELRAKISINKVSCPDYYDYASSIDGFTIIFTRGNPPTNFGGAGLLGYNEITNALVLEIDLYQNWDLGDSSSNTLSLHRCTTTKCTAREDSNSKQVDLNIVIVL